MSGGTSALTQYLLFAPCCHKPAPQYWSSEGMVGAGPGERNIGGNNELFPVQIVLLSYSLATEGRFGA